MSRPSQGREGGPDRRLIGAEPLAVAPSEGARLRALAGGKARRPRSLREAVEDENLRILARLRGVGVELASRFGLRFASLEAEREGVNGHYGICYRDGVIRVRLRHAATGKPLKESSLVDTLCHELAHLRHFDHSPRFRGLYLRILEEARRRGHYRPGPAPAPPPRTLFDGFDRDATEAGTGRRAGGRTR